MQVYPITQSLCVCVCVSSDGVGRSGAFLCIHSQLERLKTEREILKCS